MKKFDYMVSTTNYEMIYDTLREARKEAINLSVEFGYAVINKWVLLDGDMVISEDFEILYENGVIYG